MLTMIKNDDSAVFTSLKTGQLITAEKWVAFNEVHGYTLELPCGDIVAIEDADSRKAWLKAKEIIDAVLCGGE